MPELPHIKFTIAEVERMIRQIRDGHSGLVLHTLTSKHMSALIEIAVASGQLPQLTRPTVSFMVDADETAALADDTHDLVRSTESGQVLSVFAKQFDRALLAEVSHQRLQAQPWPQALQDPEHNRHQR